MYNFSKYTTCLLLMNFKLLLPSFSSNPNEEEFSSTFSNLKICILLYFNRNSMSRLYCNVKLVYGKEWWKSGLVNPTHHVLHLRPVSLATLEYNNVLALTLSNQAVHWESALLTTYKHYQYRDFIFTHTSSNGTLELFSVIS